MCISPSNVWIQRGPNWEQTPVPCKRCWRCKENRKNDYIARSMCEMSVSEHTCAITLTYAPRDDLADKVVTQHHFQLFMKRLRRAGHKVRYLVAGEYGDLKGRAHFHALLFFSHLQDSPTGVVPFYASDHVKEPDLSAPFSRLIPDMQMVHICEWPHGHVKCDWSANERAARYVCEYVLDDRKKNGWFSLSKKPPLGAAWFAQKAETAKRLNVLPSTFEYTPPGGTEGRSYMMTGATRRDYLAACAGDSPVRSSMSEWVGKTYDKHDLKRRVDAGECWIIENPEDYERLLLERLEPSHAEAAKIFRNDEMRILRDDFHALPGQAFDQALARRLGFDDFESFDLWRNTPDGDKFFGFCQYPPMYNRKDT